LDALCFELDGLRLQTETRRFESDALHFKTVLCRLISKTLRSTSENTDNFCHFGPCPSVFLRLSANETTSCRSVSRTTAGRGRPPAAGETPALPYSFFIPLRALSTKWIGHPTRPRASRNWFSRKRR